MTRKLHPFESLLGFCLSLTCLAALPAPARTWTTQRPLPTGNALNGIVALDKDVVFACGDFGRVYKTLDGGATWSGSDAARKELNGLAAGSRAVLYAVGDSGTIVATRDGGVTWSPQASGTAVRLASVSASGADIAWAAGGGTVLRTLNGGVTWTAVSTGTAATGSLSAVDGRIAYAATGRDTVLKTEDGGTTWARQYVGPAQPREGATASVASVSAVDKDTAFAVVDYIVNSLGYSSVFRTQDGGIAWTAREAPCCMPFPP
jgi:photosystem II stability/assembly factor-like uncharacterized protein